MTLDREGTTSAVGLDVSTLFVVDNGPDLGLRENLWARYISPLKLGAYAQFAVSQTFATVNQGAISDLELGGLYVVDLSGMADLTFRLGIGIPSGPSDDFPAVATNLYNSFARVHDFALAVPRAVWLRPGVGLRAGDRSLFAQVDVGVDIPVKNDDAGREVEPYLHLNAGVGTTQGPVAVAVELATTRLHDDDDFLWLHNLGLSVRYVDGPIQPFLAYVLPFRLGEPLMAHVVTAGVQGTF